MKDYRDMLSSLKDKVVDVAGKATVAVTDVAGKAVSDEMRDKVAGAAHTVSERAKYASRMTRLTVDCNAELERVKRTYTEIGRLYYENYRDTADAFLAELCQQVTDANAHVAEMEAQMDELRAAAREYRPAPDLHTIDAEEVIDPQDIGLNESVIALTARSGRAALVHRLELLGYDLTQEELDATYEKFLALADRKKEIHDYDLLYLVGDIDRMKQQSISLKFMQVTTGTLVPTATVVLKFGDHERMSTATGNGPVDAAVSAIKKLINEKVVLAEFLMQAITRGSNDVGRVHVQVECGSRTVHGFGAHTDTTRASIEAFLDALRALNVTEKIEEED